jgi:hypothetical protein
VDKNGQRAAPMHLDVQPIWDPHGGQL